MENLRIYTATYNVGTETPFGVSLLDLLSLEEDRENEKLPDLYILSFQEVNAQPQNLLINTLIDDPWTQAIKDHLRDRDYVNIKSIRLQGLLLVVFALRRHILNIKDVESNYTRTGFSGKWGNKGAVSVRLNIYGCSLCFVNSHLTAHDENCKSRIQDYNKIIEDQKFHVAGTKTILSHDYVFWMGDLNFRLLMEYEHSPEEIEREVEKKELKKLLENDQLKFVMDDGTAFHELTEKQPDFPPTFKYEVGTSNYDHKRRPAWCDRILHRVNAKNYENVTLSVDQLSYRSHPMYTLSDHKPVSAEFLIKVFSDYNESMISFDHVATWDGDSDNKVTYSISKDFDVEAKDWIAVFKDGFTGLDEYVTYEYMRKCSNPIGEIDGAWKFEATFSNPSKCDSYRLVYFSHNKYDVTRVMAISNAFSIVKN